MPTFGSGSPGWYRVRVSRRPAEDDGDVWRLQFWPEAGTPEPPRWLARSRAATRRSRSGWDDVLGYEAVELAFVVGAAGGGGRGHGRAGASVVCPAWAIAGLAR